MGVKIVNRFYHDCDLPRDARTFQITSPYSTFFERGKTKVRSWTTVNPTIFKEAYFKSFCAYRAERKRHIRDREFKYIIHPFSSFTKFRKLVMGILMFVCYILESFLNAFIFQQPNVVHFDTKLCGDILVLLEVVLLLDVITKFFEGYVDSKTQKIILEPQLIRRRYLKTFFIFDFIPPFAVLVFTIYLDVLKPKLNISPGEVRRFAFFFNQLHRFRIGRTNMILKTLDFFFKKLRLSETCRKIAFLVILCLTILHTFNCASFEIRFFRNNLGVPFQDNWIQIYIREENLNLKKLLALSKEVNFTRAFYFYWLSLCAVTCHFFGLRVHFYRTRDPCEESFFAIITIIGLCFQTFCFAYILEHFSVVQLAERDYDQFVEQVEHFLWRRDIPIEIADRVFMYFDYKYHRKFFAEKEILDTLSEHLQLEILLYSCAGLINDVVLFQGLSKDATGCILALLKQDIFLEGDPIHISTEDTGNIYFILYGTCQVELISNSKEAMHLEDGDHFGDVGRFDEGLGITEMYQVRAIEKVEVFKFDRDNIEFCCQKYPELIRKLESLAKGKARKYNATFDATLTEEDTTEDILEELRKGKILHQGIKRKSLLLVNYKGTYK